jgi:predicted nucleic acid-binding protein
MVLLDTNLVSYFFRRDSRAAAYAPALMGQVRGIAHVTLAELYKWPLERGWGERRRLELEVYLASHVVLPSDDLLARRWAEMSVKLKRAGRGITDADAWIAATALRHQVPLATHNRRHFEHIPGLTLISFAPH